MNLLTGAAALLGHDAGALLDVGGVVDGVVLWPGHLVGVHELGAVALRLDHLVEALFAVTASGQGVSLDPPCPSERGSRDLGMLPLPFCLTVCLAQSPMPLYFPTFSSSCSWVLMYSAG